MDDLSVEIRKSPGIVLKGKVVDLLPDGVLVELDNCHHTQREYPFSQVAFPSKQDNNTYTVGDSIEVSTALESEDGMECWVAGRVHLVKGDFVVALFDQHDEHQQDIFSCDKVRRPNTNEPITSQSIHSHNITVPEELSQICEDMSNHKELLQKCGASLIYYRQHALVILSTDEGVIKKARLLGDMHVKGLKQKSALFQMMKDASKKLELQSTRHHHHPLANHLDSFAVHKELMGLAIGSQGNNIQQAKQIPGIKGIELDENTGTFTVYGDTTEVVARARAVLEFKKEILELPKSLIARVIGRNGNHIQDIVDKSGVVRVQIKSEQEDNPGPEVDENELVPFVFIGTADSISNAKLLMDYHVTHLKEVEQLTQQKRQLDAELRNLTINSNNHPSYMFRHPRYHRDGEMEHDSMRGSMRGNMRGGRAGMRGGMRYPGNNSFPQMNDQRGNFPEPHFYGEEALRGRGRYRGGRYPRPYGGAMAGGGGKGGGAKGPYHPAGGEGEGGSYKQDRDNNGAKVGSEQMINGQG